MKRFFLSLILCASAQAIPIALTKDHFRTEKFKKGFVGSYEFLPKVEPKVSSEENQMLADLTTLFDRGRFKEAESKLATFIRQQKQPGPEGEAPKKISPAMIFVLGNLYYQNGRSSEAERSYRLAIKAFSEFRRAHKNLARLLSDQEKYQEALPHLQKAIELGDSDQLSFGLLGYIYLNDDNPISAEIAYRQALLLAPKERDWKYGLAQCLVAQEKWPEAVAFLKVLIKEEPDNAALWRQQANIYLSMDRRLDAAKNFEVLRRMKKLNEEDLHVLGNIYVDQQEPFLALGAYLEAINISQTPNIERTLEAARIMVDFGAPDKADQLLAEIEGKKMSNPERVSSLVVKAKSASAQEDDAQVEKHLKEIISLAPSNGDAFIEYGLLLERQAADSDDEIQRDNLYMEAAAKFRSALSIESVAFDANLRYGQMQVRRQKFVKAMPFLEKAEQLKPSENLNLYVRRVRRAAGRQKEMEEAVKAKLDQKKS